MTKKIRHSKYKNTGILFELLTKQTTTDILNENDSSLAINLIKKYFGKNRVLTREYNLYEELVGKKFTSENLAIEFIDETIKVRKTLNNNLLNREKYNLIKEIKDNFDLNNFFSNKIYNYRVLGSIYKLFESISNKEKILPSNVVHCRQTLIEHIMSKPSKKIEKENLDRVLREYEKESVDLKSLAYKIMLERFNEKYKNFNKQQKELLRQYIYNVSDVNSFRKYVNNQIDIVKEDFDKIIFKINDITTKIKVQEVIKQIDKLKRGKVVKDNQLSNLMNYYQLISEIKYVVERKND